MKSIAWMQDISGLRSIEQSGRLDCVSNAICSLPHRFGVRDGCILIYALFLGIATLGHYQEGGSAAGT